MMVEFSRSLPADVRARFTRTRDLDEDVTLGVKRVLNRWSLQVLVNGELEDMWCYATVEAALEVLGTWDGSGEPPGWVEHRPTRRHRDPINGVIWSDDDPLVDLGGE